MLEIIALLTCFDQTLPGTNQRQLAVIITAMLRMTGRVTMLGMSRWTDKGGSYRTIQRFFHTVQPWAQMLWLFFLTHLYEQKHEYILAGDESVLTKAGKKTYGIDRFFSSIYGKPVRGLALFALALIDVTEDRSTPILVEQVIKSEKVKAESKTQQKKKKKRGRPKGSKNKDKTVVAWTPELQRIDQMLRQVLKTVNGFVSIRYIAMDGHFGNNNAAQMVLKAGLHLVSKLRYDSALHFRYDGEQKPHGAKRRYGEKIDYQVIPVEHLVFSTTEKNIRTDIYQAVMLHKAFAAPLNVVVIVKTNLTTLKRAHVILFSTDLDLDAEALIHYYRLRFQIEFNFRDAKQFWGLEDFMVVEKTAVTNAIQLSLFMVSLSQRLLLEFRKESPQAGVLDLKTYFRGRYYASETLKMLPQKPEPILFQRITHFIASLGSIHSPYQRAKAA
jgi:hypothetical protein